MEKYIAAYVKAAASLTAAQAKLASALAAVSAAQNMISPVLLTSMVGLGEEGLANGLGYLTSRITKNFERPTTWMFTCGQWILRENKHTIYHMYIKDVDAGTTGIQLGAEEKHALEKALGYVKE